MGRPGISGLGLVEDSFPRNRRDLYEVVAARTLDLASGVRRVARQMLMAMRTLKLEFAHDQSLYNIPDCK